ncbi:Uncharacterised protein [Yersinia nurmii]|uniref:Uncharacterized protein n=1 Tax=Yersinia nurmii TaxID=685706 RepID=A0ABP1YH71_9GAMM|nr:Uncharacterised protein [Yersinia nurmii]
MAKLARWNINKIEGALRKNNIILYLNQQVTRYYRIVLNITKNTLT